MRGAKFLTLFVARRLRPKIAQAERELNRLIALVDAFYERLGRRNWIFHDSLPADDIEQLLAETDHANSAERLLIALYRRDGFLRQRILMIQPHEGMRARRHHPVFRGGSGGSWRPKWCTAAALRSSADDLAGFRQRRPARWFAPLPR